VDRSNRDEYHIRISHEYLLPIESSYYGISISSADRHSSRRESIHISHGELSEDRTWNRESIYEEVNNKKKQTINCKIMEELLPTTTSDGVREIVIILIGLIIRLIEKKKLKKQANAEPQN
jgi:hypothetical protein